MSMNFSLKAKCQGCLALKESGGVFSCFWGIELKVKMLNNEQTQPTPYIDKCYKPKTRKELREAKILMPKKGAVASA